MEYIKRVRELLKNPKNKSLTLLGIYLIFFIFVFIIIGSSDSVSTSSYKDYIEKEEEKKQVISYGYIYNINDNGNITNINGTLNEIENTYNYNGNNYIKKEGITYLNGETTEEIFNVDKYNYLNIEKLIESSTFVEKTIYQDNSERTTYTLTMDKYFSIITDINNCTTIDCTIINSSIIVQSNENINSVSIDLSNYYGYNYIVDISYLNIIKQA